PLKKDAKNNCFCYNCNTKRISALICCYKIKLNPFAVIEIPLHLAELLFDFLRSKGHLSDLDREENRKMGEILRICFCKSSQRNYYYYGEGNSNFEKDIGISIENLDLDLINKYKNKYYLIISNDYLISKQNIEIEQNIANFIENNTCVYYERCLEETVNEIQKICAYQKVESNEDLIKAVSTSLLSPISLIIGEAGTGKTKSIELIQKILEKNNISCCGMAFTGKAVDKLTNRFSECKIDILDQPPDFPLYTIHSFIYHIKTIPKVIIVDEASMLSTPLAWKL